MTDTANVRNLQTHKMKECSTTFVTHKMFAHGVHCHPWHQHGKRQIHLLEI